jgi:hypothetical protein
MHIPVVLGSVQSAQLGTIRESARGSVADFRLHSLVSQTQRPKFQCPKRLTDSYARAMKGKSAKPTVLQAFGGLWFGLAILRSEIRLSGYQAQPSGLRPHATLPCSELSHSLVNMAQWLTGATRSLRKGPRGKVSCLGLVFTRFVVPSPGSGCMSKACPHRGAGRCFRLFGKSDSAGSPFEKALSTTRTP